MDSIVIQHEPSWEWYRTFLAVLETGSLSAAGRAIGISQPTAGRHIDGLESALALKLFTRSSDGFSPTSAAYEIAPYAVNLAAMSAALLRKASEGSTHIGGTVRLTVSEVIGVEVLPPILSALRNQHPELVVEMILSNQVDDLLRRDADIAIRMYRPTQNALIARQVGGIEVGLYAHRSYLATHGSPDSLEDLASHTLIGFDRETAFIRGFLKQFPTFARPGLAFRADSELAQLAVMRAGFGIGVCQSTVAARDSALIRVLPSAFSVHMDTWVAMHEDLRNSARCQVVFNALAEGLRMHSQNCQVPMPNVC
ncbi:DNA-binding transcriptional regulator, LysR family [Pseudomonas congelans]|uniref:DNA-binding transcriptional regulator, LysR family n=1 Tax=Pseudomonas congelans TaxID=200452 RepID=A0A0P9LXB7_9PSED|nr:LysR family transcriptional regulator [Pseudomonas congelans]MBC8801963.1 LysR family transcriptional regulator [Pseudomonas congelans]SDO58836.1 DNA-binding transcriptional regulator, LysR family [Pseudomonas congelans]